MEQQIIIDTNGAGVKLYNSANESLNFYATHLDELNKWDKMLDELMILRTNYAIDYGVELKDLKMLISINSVLSRAIADLHLISAELYISKARLKQIFYIKHAYLIIFETFENLRAQQNFLNKTVFEAGGVFLEDFKKWTKSKKDFFKKHDLEKSIKTVRDKLAGHIELDFKLWYEMAILLDAGYTTSLIIDYMKLLEPLQSLTTQMVYLYKDNMNIAGQKLKQKNIDILNQLEQLVQKVNEQQPEGSKIEIDLSILKNLLS